MHGKSTDVDGRFCRRADCLQKFPLARKKLTEVEGTADVQKVVETWRKVPLTYGKLIKGPVETRKVGERSHGHTKVDGSVPKVLHKHRMLYGRSRGRMESSRKVPWMHKSWRKSTESPAQARNVDGSFHGCTESLHKVPQSHGKLMAGTVDTREVDGKSHGCSECWRKIPWTQRKLTEVHRRSHGCTENWQKIPQKHEKCI